MNQITLPPELRLTRSSQGHILGHWESHIRITIFQKNAISLQDQKLDQSMEEAGAGSPRQVPVTAPPRKLSHGSARARAGKGSLSSHTEPATRGANVTSSQWQALATRSRILCKQFFPIPILAKMMPK